MFVGASQWLSTLLRGVAWQKRQKIVAMQNTNFKIASNDALMDWVHVAEALPVWIAGGDGVHGGLGFGELRGLDGAGVLFAKNHVPRFREFLAQPPIADDVLVNTQGLGQFSDSLSLLNRNIKYFHSRKSITVVFIVSTPK